MNLTSLTPNTIYGWAGLAAFAYTILYHKTLTTVGLFIGLGVGFYLYFVMDTQAQAAA